MSRDAPSAFPGDGATRPQSLLEAPADDLLGAFEGPSADEPFFDEPESEELDESEPEESELVDLEESPLVEVDVVDDEPEDDPEPPLLLSVL